MWTYIVKAALALLGLFTGRKDPTAVDLAASNATAQANLKQVEQASAIQDKASGARADASGTVVRVITNTPAAADVNGALAKQFPDDFRD